jgi:tetratricopeptide (TPR) repeat protein
MHSKRRFYASMRFFSVLIVASAFTLCQKGGQTGSTAKVIIDKKAVTFEAYEAGSKDLPMPPKVYIGPWEARGDEPDLYKKGKKSEDKKKYKTAVEQYAEFIEKNPKNFYVPDATLRMARCHYQLSEFDQALEALGAFLDSKPGLLWEARTMTTLSELYLALPYAGYERSGKIYYNYDEREGEYKYMSDENRDEAVSFREKVRLAYIALLGAPVAKRGSQPDDDLKDEAVVNSFQLVEVLQQSYWEHYDRCPPQKPLDPPPTSAIYDPGWSEREKVLFLLDEIPLFNKGRSDRHPEAWAGFKKALYLMRYPECAPEEWTKKQSEAYDKWSEKH